jgi:Putative transposase
MAVVVDGFNVYVGNAIDGRDRKRVERMGRYLARPPIALERLTETGDGDELRYELKRIVTRLEVVRWWSLATAF